MGMTPREQAALVIAGRAAHAGEGVERAVPEADLRRLARMREAGDDHFYGAWRGGAKSEGGHPGGGLREQPFGGKVDYAAKPKAPWGDAKGAAWLKKNAERYDTDPQFQAAADAVVCYTTGGYDTIRMVSDPDGTTADIKGWNAEFMAANPREVLETAQLGAVSDKGFTGHAFPQQIDPKDHDQTNSIHTVKEGADALGAYVDASPRRSEPIYRGLPEHGRIDEPGRHAIPKVGDTMNIQGLTSFTRDEKTATRFASQTVTGGKNLYQPDREWVIEVRNARGLDVDALSPYRQQEVISRGNFRVVSVTVDREHAKEKDYQRDANGRALVNLPRVERYRPFAWQEHPGRSRSWMDSPAEYVRVVLEGID